MNSHIGQWFTLTDNLRRPEYRVRATKEQYTKHLGYNTKIEKRGVNLIHGHYNSTEENKEPIYTFIIPILFLIVILMIACLLPDQGPEKIKQKLEERGYSVADIDFTRTEKFGNIYISSQPIEISEGIACEYWQIVTYGTIGMFQAVSPYPDGWPQPVSVSITLEPEEYQELLISAGNESIENYIKDKLFTGKTE